AKLRSAGGQKVERFGFGQLLATDREPEIGNGLVKKSRPRGAPGDVFLVQQLLNLVRELMRPKGSGVAQPRAVAGECRIGLLRCKIGVLDTVQLESEE